MTPERARVIGQTYRSLADQYTEAGGDAAHLERQSQWWLTHATTLETKPPGGNG